MVTTATLHISLIYRLYMSILSLPFSDQTFSLPTNERKLVESSLRYASILSMYDVVPLSLSLIITFILYYCYRETLFVCYFLLFSNYFTPIILFFAR